MQPNASNEEYIDSFLNTIDHLYPNAMKKSIIRTLKNTEMVTQNESDINGAQKFPVYFDSCEDIIPDTIADPDFFGFYENFEYDKSYKYSIPLVYEIDGNNDEFNSCLNELTQNGELRLFNNSDKFEDYNEVFSPNINSSIPFYKKTENYILFKFVFAESTLKFENNVYVPIKIRYPIIISINLNNNFLDIRFDGGKFDSESQIDYIYPKIRELLKWMKDKLHFKIFNVQHNDIIDIIKNDKKSNVAITKQMMQLKSGGSAELTASEKQEYRIPFIGDLRELINNNPKVNEEARELINDFLDDYEETSEYPYIHVKWIKNNKAQSFVDKIVFNYYNGSLIQIHHMNSANVKRERIENAIEYLFENGAFVKGAEI